MQEDAPNWFKAIDSELNLLKETKTYSIVIELPKGRVAIGNK
jgi:hypothetical protein